MASPLRSLLLTELLAGYLSERFRWYRSRASGPGPSPPAMMPLKLIVECEILASQASRAYDNRGYFTSTRSFQTCSFTLCSADIVGRVKVYRRYWCTTDRLSRIPGSQASETLSCRRSQDVRLIIGSLYYPRPWGKDYLLEPP